jgi:invasion protein IalB
MAETDGWSSSMPKTMIARLACAALLFGAAPIAAQTTSTGATPAPNSKQKDPNRIICERQQEVGSRLASKRVCMTAVQWEEQHRRDREAVEENQRRSLEPNSG